MEKEKILVVDDDQEVQDFLCTILEADGYRVRICGNGLRVEAALREFQPDLLVLDVMLPGMDGYTLAQGLPAVASGRGLPMIVLSGLAHSAAMFQGLPQVAAFFHKPVSAQEFLEAVRHALASGGADRAGTT